MDESPVETLFNTMDESPVDLNLGIHPCRHVMYNVTLTRSGAHGDQIFLYVGLLIEESMPPS